MGRNLRGRGFGHADAQKWVGTRGYKAALYPKNTNKNSPLGILGTSKGTMMGAKASWVRYGTHTL